MTSGRWQWLCSDSVSEEEERTNKNFVFCGSSGTASRWHVDDDNEDGRSSVSKVSVSLHNHMGKEAKRK